MFINPPFGDFGAAKSGANMEDCEPRLLRDS
jgi:hypothetical protein